MSSFNCIVCKEDKPINIGKYSFSTCSTCNNEDMKLCGDCYAKLYINTGMPRHTPPCPLCRGTLFRPVDRFQKMKSFLHDSIEQLTDLSGWGDISSSDISHNIDILLLLSKKNVEILEDLKIYIDDKKKDHLSFIKEVNEYL